MERISRINRKTKETDITLTINLDGTGEGKINTGIGFFDHMLEGFAKHGFFDLEVTAIGDLYVDGHHTVEDTGIVLGQAIRQALGEKKGIKRFGNFMLPMDESLVVCAIDLSGRPYLVCELGELAPMAGELDTQLIQEFFYALSYSAGMNLHIKKIHGSNTHHIIEAAFKAFAKALDEATSSDSRIKDVLSTKGMIEK